MMRAAGDMSLNENYQKIDKYIEYLLDNSSAEAPMWNKEMIRSGKPNKWNYIDGCMITAFLSLYEITGNKRYLDFCDSFDSFFVKEDGSVSTYNGTEYNLDNINPAKNLFALYDLTGKEKYRKAIDTVRSQLGDMPRTHEGNFWHKKIYPYQVWLDGLYMAQPFYMEYETRYNHMKECRDSFTQFENVTRLMKDKKTGLYYHGYDETRSMYWADPQTGCSPNFWLRATGWFACALVSTAQVMDESIYYEYRFLQTTLEELVESLLPFQDESGMFYQIVDKKNVEGNYLETSGTALIAYAILKGVRLGYLPERYRIHGIDAFNGIIRKYLKENPDGTFELGGICLVAGLGGENHRDGSLDYYFSEPVVENEAKGIAPFILAYTEILRLEL